MPLGEEELDDMVDFLADWGADSDDGDLPELPTHEEEAPDPAVPVPAAPANSSEPDAQTQGVPAPAPPDSSPVDGDDGEWTSLRRVFLRSDTPRQVAAAYARVPNWQGVESQVALWNTVLAQRMADGAGSREYVAGVLKAVVNMCDNERVEVSEQLLAELLELQTSAAARKLEAERATLQEVQGEAAAEVPDQAATATASTDAAAASCNLATQRPRYAQEEGPEAWAVACLPCPEDAQILRAVRKPGALSKDEIEGLLSMLPLMRDAGAGVQKRTGLAAAGAGGRASRSVPGAVVDDDPSAWVTTYLHTNHLFQTRFAELFGRLRKLALDTDDEHWGIRRACEAGDCGAVRARVIEVHEAGPGAGLAADKHYDSGSIVTLDVLLSPTTDFEGGQLQMMEPDGTKTRPTFEQGDAVIFPSHKYHTVVPVLSGRRRTLILEFWCGEERLCPHRCEQHWGACNYNALHLPTSFQSTADGSSPTQPEGQPQQGPNSKDSGKLTREYDNGLMETWPRFHQRMQSDCPLSLSVATEQPTLRVAALPPPMPQPDPLADGLDALLLAQPLRPEQLVAFKRDGHIRLRNVIPDTVLAAARAELISIVLPAMKGGQNASDPSSATKASLRRHNTGVGGAAGLVAGSEADDLWKAVSAGQPWHVQRGWKLRACVHQLVLAPRLGQILCQLLDIDTANGIEQRPGGGVRLYQEDAVSRPPGTGRTEWARQGGIRNVQQKEAGSCLAFDPRRWKAATVWIPLQQTAPEMGAPAFSAEPPPDAMAELQQTEHGETPHADDSRESIAVGVHSWTYNLGDISVRLVGSDGPVYYHCHPPNHTTATRMGLECTYFADGATMCDDEETTAAYEAGKFHTIAPGVKPGELIATDRNPLVPKPSIVCS